MFNVSASSSVPASFNPRPQISELVSHPGDVGSVSSADTQNLLEAIDSWPFYDVAVDIPNIKKMVRLVSELHSSGKAHGSIKPESFEFVNYGSDAVEVVLAESTADRNEQSIPQVELSPDLPPEVISKLAAAKDAYISTSEVQQADVYFLGLAMYKALYKKSHPLELLVKFHWRHNRAVPSKAAFWETHVDAQSGLAEHIRFAECKQKADTLALIVQMTHINPHRRPKISNVEAIMNKVTAQNTETVGARGRLGCFPC